MDKKIDIKETLKIKNLKDISPEQIIRLIELSPEIDKDTFEKILKQIPNIIENNKAMIDGIGNIVNKNKEMSSDTKVVYNQMINALKDMMNHEGNDKEINIELIKLMDKIREDIKELDKNDKIQANDQMDKMIKFAEKTLIVLGAGIGLRFVIKKNFKV